MPPIWRLLLCETIVKVYIDDIESNVQTLTSNKLLEVFGQHSHKEWLQRLMLKSLQTFLWNTQFRIRKSSANVF